TMIGNDRWTAAFTLRRNGRYVYTIAAWRDLFATWRAEIVKKRDAGQDIRLELAEGIHLVKDAVAAAAGGAREALSQCLAAIDDAATDGDRLSLLIAEDFAALMRSAAPRTNLSQYDHVLEIVADRSAAGFSAW